MREEFFAISRRGASHFASGKPLQDASKAIKGDGYCVAIVCDGHGGEKHFRSEIGSKFAVGVAIEKFEEFVKAYPTYEKCSGKGESERIRRLEISILSGWQCRLDEYTKMFPFTDEEEKKFSNTFRGRKDYDVRIPYGTTLLAALVARDYYLFMIIGDGAIIKIKPDLSAEVMTFEGKHEYTEGPHSATDSLCQPECFSKIFTRLEKTDEPALAFGICSDGLTESYETNEALCKKMVNYLNFLAEEGMQSTIEAVGNQLDQISKLASKDDMSVAFATNCLSAFDKRKHAEEQPAQQNDK